MDNNCPENRPRKINKVILTKERSFIMKKYESSNFIQLRREIFTDKDFLELSINAKWLYFVLNELEHRFTGEKQSGFSRSNEELARDCGFCIRTLIRAKQELIKTKWVKFKYAHWEGYKPGKKSEKHISYYELT